MMDPFVIATLCQCCHLAFLFQSRLATPHECRLWDGKTLISLLTAHKVSLSPAGYWEEQCQCFAISSCANVINNSYTVQLQESNSFNTVAPGLSKKKKRKKIEKKHISYFVNACLEEEQLLFLLLYKSFLPYVLDCMRHYCSDVVIFDLFLCSFIQLIDREIYFVILHHCCQLGDLLEIAYFLDLFSNLAI